MKWAIRHESSYDCLITIIQTLVKINSEESKSVLLDEVKKIKQKKYIDEEKQYANKSFRKPIKELIKSKQTDDIPYILNKLETNYSKKDLINKLYKCQQEIITVEKNIKNTYSYRIGKFLTTNLRKIFFIKASRL